MGRTSHLEQLLEEQSRLLQEMQSSMQAAAAAAHSPQLEHRSPNSAREGHGIKVCNYGVPRGTVCGIVCVALFSFGSAVRGVVLVGVARGTVCGTVCVALLFSGSAVRVDALVASFHGVLLMPLLCVCSRPRPLPRQTSLMAELESALAGGDGDPPAPDEDGAGSEDGGSATEGAAAPLDGKRQQRDGIASRAGRTPQRCDCGAVLFFFM